MPLWPNTGTPTEDARLTSMIRINALILIASLSLVMCAPRFGNLERDQYVSYALGYTASLATAAGTWLRLRRHHQLLLLAALAVAMIAAIWMAVDVVLVTSVAM
ncbi:hypothetical protein [Actinoplanes sp. HUAS TT8]|uniref:hypothetical protein n=1 Tax=Actinoplanes sp. HUAS TT8 TaxID=3447453 RepID=UPI003F520889